MRARAPGKLVLSGAYAVLYGAPAIVTAVSRYAIADTGRAAEFVTPEVRAAIGDRCAPWFDANASHLVFAGLDADLSDLARRGGVSSWLFT